MTDEGKKFAIVSNVPPFIIDSGVYPTVLNDSGLVSAKNLVDLAFNFSGQKAMQKFVLNSTCFPVGAIETSHKYILVYNVVISESLLRDKEINLNKGFHFHPIESLHFEDLFQRDIAESLIIVKSEEAK